MVCCGRLACGELSGTIYTILSIPYYTMLCGVLREVGLLRAVGTLRNGLSKSSTSATTGAATLAWAFAFALSRLPFGVAYGGAGVANAGAGVAVFVISKIAFSPMRTRNKYNASKCTSRRPRGGGG